MATYRHETGNVHCIGCRSVMVITYRNGTPYRLGCPDTSCSRSVIDLTPLVTAQAVAE